jgi:hypothetical protein
VSFVERWKMHRNAIVNTKLLVIIEVKVVMLMNLIILIIVTHWLTAELMNRLHFVAIDTAKKNSGCQCRRTLSPPTMPAARAPAPDGATADPCLPPLYRQNTRGGLLLKPKYLLVVKRYTGGKFEL